MRADVKEVRSFCIGFDVDRGSRQRSAAKVAVVAWVDPGHRELDVKDGGSDHLTDVARCRGLADEGRDLVIDRMPDAKEPRECRESGLIEIHALRFSSVADAVRSSRIPAGRSEVVAPGNVASTAPTNALR